MTLRDLVQLRCKAVVRRREEDPTCKTGMWGTPLSGNGGRIGKGAPGRRSPNWPKGQEEKGRKGYL